MKKVTLLLIALLPMLAQAQVSLDNATTVEALIGQCPDLPAAGTLAAAMRDGHPDANKAVRLFSDKMEKIRKRFREITDAAEETSKENMARALDKQVRKQTGKSIDEIANMSEAEQKKMGEEKANSILKKMGIKKSAKELENAELSEAEIERMAADAAKKMTGMSMKELQALEKMSEEEQMAYMQQGGRMERMQKAGAGAKTPTSARQAQSVSEIQEEMKKIHDQWRYIDNLHQKEIRELSEEIGRIETRYEAQMPKPSGKIKEHGVTLLEVYTPEEEKLIKRLTLARDTECFTLWRNQVSKMQGRLKNRLTDAPRVDELNAKYREALGMAAEIPISAAFDVVKNYLDITESVLAFPHGEGGTDGETPTPNS